MKNTIGPDELIQLPFLKGEKIVAPAISFSQSVLKKCEGTHILVYVPRVSWITLNGLREKFGMDPAHSEPCFYNQDWYEKEEFANQPADGAWHLVRKDVLEEARAKSPEDIETSLSGEKFPTAITAAFTFIAWWFVSGGEKLWKHDFLWCSDHDGNGDRIYVGRYEDPSGVSKSGFNVHRHLLLRSSYSSAPEVIG